MVGRGSRVIITKTNSSGKTRPWVGDVGFIGNMFWFPSYNFILSDISFYSDNKGKPRKECRKVVINLGMDSSLRYKIASKGVSKKFFLNETPVNLTPLFFRTTYAMHPYKRNENGTPKFLFEYPTLFGPYGIWTDNNIHEHVDPGGERKYIIMRQRKKLSTIKIPIVELAWLNSKFDLSDNEHAMRAWFNAVLAPINYFADHGGNYENDLDYETSVNKQINESFGRLRGPLRFKSAKRGHGAHVTLYSPGNKKERSALLYELQKIRALWNNVLWAQQKSFALEKGEDLEIKVSVDKIHKGVPNVIHSALCKDGVFNLPIAKSVFVSIVRLYLYRILNGTDAKRSNNVFRNYFDPKVFESYYMQFRYGKLTSNLLKLMLANL